MAATNSTKNKRKNFNPRFNLNLSDDLNLSSDSSNEQKILEISRMNVSENNGFVVGVESNHCNSQIHPMNPRKLLKIKNKRPEVAGVAATKIKDIQKLFKKRDHEQIHEIRQNLDSYLSYNIPNTNFTLTTVPNIKENLKTPEKSKKMESVGNFIKNVEQITKSVENFPKNIENVGTLIKSTEGFSSFSENLNAFEAACGDRLPVNNSSIRDYAVKTVQELLNIYGLSISTTEVTEALNMHLGMSPEPPTPPSTPKIQTNCQSNNQLQQPPTVSLSNAPALAPAPSHHHQQQQPPAATTPTSVIQFSETVHQSQTASNQNNNKINSPSMTLPNLLSNSHIDSFLSQNKDHSERTTPSPKRCSQTPELLMNLTTRKERTPSLSESPTHDTSRHLDSMRDQIDDLDNSDSDTELDSKSYENFLKFEHSFSKIPMNLKMYEEEQNKAGGDYFNKRPDIYVKNFGKADNFGSSMDFDESLNTSSSFSDVGFFSPIMSQFALGDSNDKTTKADYSRYLTKYSSHVECQVAQCRADNVREHFHCCHSDICAMTPLAKKEQITRHLKWHQKRSDSLNHGFLRFSSTDDCSSQFNSCSHNRKQTHYHCLQQNCDKVYISTSDVQMHSNYHRKDTAIIQEGFQRYRATEECNAEYCIFFKQRTTHFHCRRKNCQFTFKNKADMEKHKSYHIKDEQLSKDGFKKFLKTEHCNFKTCKFSKICNHIHCIRDNCNYVLHSSGQLFSHKRKHERKENEQNYRKFKMATKNDGNSSIHGEMFNSDPYPTQVVSPEVCTYSKVQLPNDLSTKSALAYGKSVLCSDTEISILPTDLSLRSKNIIPELTYPSNAISPDNLTTDLTFQKSQPTDFSLNMSKSVIIPDVTYNKSPAPENLIYAPQTIVKSNLDSTVVLPASSPIGSDTVDINLEENIPTNFIKIRPKVPQENLNDFLEKYLTELCTNNPDLSLEERQLYNNSENEPLNLKNSINNDSDSENEEKFKKSSGLIECYIEPHVRHVHCLIPSCPSEKFQQVIPRNIENIYKHFRYHFDIEDSELEHSERVVHDMRLQDSMNASENLEQNNLEQIISIDGFFNRKRGRPPKNRFIEVYNSTQNSPQAIFTSFKLEKTNTESDRSYFEKLSTVPTENIENIANDEEDIDRVSVVRSSGIFFPQKTDKNISDHPPEICRPFCKLKKKAHFHCDVCNQAFTDQTKLNSHQLRHKGIQNSLAQLSELASTSIQKDIHVSEDRTDPNGSKDYPQEPHRLTTEGTSANMSVYEASPKSTKISNVDDIIGQTDIFPKIDRNPENNNDPQNMIFDQSLANFLIYQRNQFYFQNYYQQIMNQQMLMQNSTYTAENTSLQGLQDSAATLEQFSHNYDIKSLKRQFKEAEIIETVPTFKKIKLGKNSSEQNYDHNKKVNVDVPKAGVIELTHNLAGQNLIKSEKRSSVTPNFNVQTNMNKNRIFKDEPVPKGYLKFKFNEDCNFPNCGYRNHQSHFHCIRVDCCYSFCDKTRFVQHSARHERLDKLMGGDFKQFRANMNCGYQDCEYSKNLGANNKSSHFHCLSCNFICSDTNKVVAHRRQHTKLNQIKSAGFEKFTPNMSCIRNLQEATTSSSTSSVSEGACVHNLKQTHYHCLVCNYAVLGLAQMSAHKFRHME